MLNFPKKLAAAVFAALALLVGAGTIGRTVLVQPAYAAGHRGHGGDSGDRGDHRFDRGADQRDH